ncbi:hypothetical protein [Piscinibacter gummiphilus]|uniref:hypothetical protein n=1 Tax=Piscinibacter gummiphilus TaxID=946333 RepID=UPI0012F4A3E7|nr:hypothetical protein [Piscinibacter gummiphilus]GLS93441.1 hypothetical protein GCM10007918_07320 [Piscinibacter gummiphilus]
MSTADALLRALRGTVGAAHVLVEDRETRRFRKDHRTGQVGMLAVVRPGTPLPASPSVLAKAPRNASSAQQPILDRSASDPRG